MKSSDNGQISVFLLIQLIWQFQNPSFLWSVLPLLIPLFPPLHLLVWVCMRASLSPESIWSSGWPSESLSVGTDAASSLPSPSSPLPLRPPATTSPSLLSTCLGHRPGGWVAVRVPHQRLGHCFVILPKTKEYLGRAGCLPKGNTMPWGWQSLWTLGRRSRARFIWMSVRGHLLCMCVHVSNLRYYARRGGRRQRIWRVGIFVCACVWGA